MNEIKAKAEQAVREAGKLLVNAVIAQDRIEKKGYANFVTEIDYKVQEFMIDRLDKIIPGCNIITEESKNNEYNLNKPTWVLDPVDGTTNLMYDYHHSAVSLALFIEGRAVLGIIYNPTGEELFTAEVGKGAFLNGKKIKVTGNGTLEDCLIAFGTTPYERDKADRTFEIVKKAYLSCRDIRRSGSAALDIAYVACGRLDAFFEMRLQPWDFAAGMILLKEAGGRVTTWEGKDVSILKPTGIIASNKLVHESMLHLLSTKEF
jgi:myo-inositol-1(or 4)-monophosphatase